MKCSVITIDVEVLRGIATNYNGAYLSNVLDSRGLPCQSITIIPCEAKQIEQSVLQAADIADIVVVSGAVDSPSERDGKHLREAIASILKSKSVCRPDLSKKLKDRYREKINNQDEVTILPPEVSLLMHSPGNSASSRPTFGYIFSVKCSKVFVLPNDHGELKVLFKEAVLPELCGNPDKIVYDLGYLDVKREEMEGVLCRMKDVCPSLMYSTSTVPAVVYARIVAPATEDQHQQFDEAMDLLDKSYASKCFTRSGESVEEALHFLLTSRKLTIALAESCTGGAMASHLTRLPGSGEFFLGSCVTYSNEMKMEILGVPKQLIDDFDAVSKEVVTSMWCGLMGRSKADTAVAVTGYAGPGGGTKQAPIGTVWIACGYKGMGMAPHVFRIHVEGSRECVIWTTVHRALGKLYLLLEEQLS